MITADHKVLNEEQKSRTLPKYAVVVQDAATQWSQSYPCKTKSAKKLASGRKCMIHLHGQFFGFYWNATS